MALLRVAGPSRKDRLAALKERVRSYPNVSDISRNLVMKQILEMEATSVRDRTSKMKSLEGELLSVPEGKEYLVVEALLKDGLAFAAAEEVEAARVESEELLEQMVREPDFTDGVAALVQKRPPRFR
jgi:enoyl-CoA hydratase/carnithine racemase